MNSLNKGKVLVVDDDRLVLAMVAHGLSQAGFEVIDADNGDDAILLARQHKPDLALLDIRMEGKTGFDVAAYLREYCHIPFMFLSAFSDEATIRQVRELGAVTYLVKPLDIQQIIPAVEAAFAERLAHPVGAVSAGHAVPSTSPVPARTSAASGTAGTFPAATDDDVQAILSARSAIAVGMLMHRHSLSRLAALHKLQAQARLEGRSLDALCERLLDAQEVLAGLGALH